jgi:hypothetical protein
MAKQWSLNQCHGIMLRAPVQGNSGEMMASVQVQFQVSSYVICGRCNISEAGFFHTTSDFFCQL